MSTRPPKDKDETQEVDRPTIIITDADYPARPESNKKLETPSKKEVQSLSQSLSELGKHFIITVCVSGLGVLTHLILVHWFGDPKFFDLIPVRYAIDAGDIAVIATFFIIMIRELWKQEE